MPIRWTRIVALLLTGMTVANVRGADNAVGKRLERAGDEIVVCGQLYHTTAPVVLWLDPGGYDAYRVEPHFPASAGRSDDPKREGPPRPNRYGTRLSRLAPADAERVRENGWDVATLQSAVDQFVIHFDARGTSRECFRILHDVRGLSVHFMLDLDGTIYQTLDLKEAAWHATVANNRSIGIEIANVGAYPVERSSPFERWYQRDSGGRAQIILPSDASVRLRERPLRPIRDEPVEGIIQGRRLQQYDLTEDQYRSLIKLTTTLCTLFPKIRCDYPRGSEGKLVDHALSKEQFNHYQGILGHYHVQTNKVDPGPAFQWDRLIEGVKGERNR